MNGAAALRASGLACVRGERTLFSDVSFELPPGALLRVRGDNGSGKTSLLRMVCGLLPAAAGSITWNGRDIRALGEEYRGSLVYVGHLNALKDELDPVENLRFTARIAGLPAAPGDVEEALRAVGLDGARLPCRLLSQGQRRRAALARLPLARARPLWVLDEPFAALDARGVAAAHSLIESHLAHGGAVLLTTHQDAGFSGRDVPTLDF